MVIDGMNVALTKVGRYSDASEKRRQALEALRMVLVYFRERQVEATIFAPRGFVDGQRPEIEVFEEAGLLFVTPGGLDDNFFLQHADERGSFIVSNDRFLDHVRDRGYSQAWLDFHRIPFMFKPEFSPEPDAIVRMQKYHLGGTDPKYGPRRARPELKVLEEKVEVPTEVLPEDLSILTIDRAEVGRIIGKKGATVSRLEETHHVRINIKDKVTA